MCRDGEEHGAVVLASRPDSSDWCRATLAKVRKNLARTGYPPHRLHYVAGRVEETVRARRRTRSRCSGWTRTGTPPPGTSWTTSGPAGAGWGLILDDYGYWAGSRHAVDEYLAEHQLRVLMHRLDQTGG